MIKQWVSELKEGTAVNNWFAVIGFSPANTKSGDLYLRLRLGDRTGTVEARVWDSTLARQMQAQLNEGNIVGVKGVVTEYNGELQVNVEKCVQRLDGIDLTLFLPSSPRAAEDMLAELRELINDIDDAPLRSFLETLFTGDLLAKYVQAPAAKKIHHAYLGGLLEHSLEVAGLCRHVARLYPETINPSLLIAGALIHDIGKTEEYAFTVGFPQLDRALLVGGHIVLGRDILRTAFQAMPDFPQQYAMALEHMILSHHGIREWGAVEEPRTIEAIALHHADLTSGKIAQAQNILQAHQGGGWTAYDRMLQRRLWSGESGEGEEA